MCCDMLGLNQTTKEMSRMAGPQATFFVDRAGRLRGMQFERLQVIKQLGHPSC